VLTLCAMPLGSSESVPPQSDEMHVYKVYKLGRVDAFVFCGVAINAPRVDPILQGQEVSISFKVS